MIGLTLLYLVCLASGLPDVDRKCGSGEECMHKDSCSSYTTGVRRLLRERKGSPEYRKIRQELLDSVCNKEDKGVCCGSLPKAPPVPSGDSSSPSYLPFQGNCGLNPAERSSFIVGGENAEPGEFPFAALLGREVSKTRFIAGRRTTFFEARWHCGGTLINRWYVLTAAHCHRPSSRNTRVEKIRLGEWEVGRKEANFPGHQDFDIEEEDIYRHKEYRHIPFVNIINDIALIKLPKMATLNPGVQMACLPAFPDDYARSFEAGDFTGPSPASAGGEAATVVGWGYTSYDPFGENELEAVGENRVASRILQKLVQPVLSERNCSSQWSGTIPTESQVCAGGEVGKDSCKGDSGSGLFLRHGEGEPWYMLGLVSFGSMACGNGQPAVYTRVSAFLPWIKENII